jgi:O-acetyl-ADP-ribose deacetylase (regulator of RNase III)
MEKPDNFVYMQGNLFTTNQPAFGHGVNIMGKMASGFAKFVKDLYPEVRQTYIEVCERQELKPGGMLPLKAKDGMWVLNLASQDHPGPNARYEWLESSLIETFKFLKEKGLTGIALPKIGAGIGGLEWDKVEQIIFEQTAKNPEVLVELWVL